MRGKDDDAYYKEIKTEFRRTISVRGLAVEISLRLQENII